MRRLSDHQRVWFYRVTALIITCVAVHLLTVWAAPRLIMQILMNGPLAKTLDMKNKAAFPPPVTAQSRSVVMPSPDLLYSVCAFDVSQGPVRVKANPQLNGYWSIALYANNSDNFFVINDRSAKGQAVDLWLVSKEANVGGVPTPNGSTVVVAPSSTGFLLMRVLTGNYDLEKGVVEPARRTLSCAKAL
jgi:uncharacterized membrane protein